MASIIIGLYLVTKKFDVQMMESRALCAAAMRLRCERSFYAASLCALLYISTLSKALSRKQNLLCVQVSNTDSYLCV